MPFRVSNQYFNEEVIRNIQNSFSELTKLQNQLTTTKQFERPSEDPISANQAILIEKNLHEVQQYRKNVETGSELLVHSDQVVSTIRALVSEATAKAAQGLNNATEPDGLPAIAAELTSILDSVISVANSNLAGRFIFAGQNYLKTPFERVGNDVFFNGDNDAFNVNVFSTEAIQANFNANDVFGALRTELVSENDPNARVASLSISSGLPAGTLKLQEGSGLEVGTLDVTVSEGDTLETIVASINTAARTKTTTVATDAATAAITAYQAQGGALTVGGQTIAQTDLVTIFGTLSRSDEVEAATKAYLDKKYSDGNTVPSVTQTNAIEAGVRAARNAYSASEFSAALSRGGIDILHRSGRKLTVIEGDSASKDLFAEMELLGRRSSKTFAADMTLTGSIATDQTLTLTAGSSKTVTVDVRAGDTTSVVARRINRAVNGTSVDKSLQKIVASVITDPTDGNSKLRLISDQGFAITGVTELSDATAVAQSSLVATHNRVENLRGGVGLANGAVQLEATNTSGYGSDVSIREGDSLDYIIRQLDDLAGFEASIDSSGRGISFQSVARYSTTITPVTGTTVSITQDDGTQSQGVAYAAGGTLSALAESINALSSTLFKFHAEVDSTGTKLTISSNEKFSVSDGNTISITSSGLDDHTSSTLTSSDIVDSLGLSETMSTTGLVAGSSLLGRQIRISELNGGSGATMGKIQIRVGTATPVEIDLSTARTLRDVKETVESALPGQVTVKINDNENGLAIVSTDSSKLLVEELNGGVTARQLGFIPAPASSIESSNIQGTDINPVGSGRTLLRDLNGGSGVDLTGFKITNGKNSTTITFDTDGDGVDDVRTIQELVNHINNKSNQDQVSVTASLDDATGKIKIASRLSNTSLTIEELAQNHQFFQTKGITVPGADQTLTVTNNLGTETFTVTMSSTGSLQDIADSINSAARAVNFKAFARVGAVYDAAAGTTTSQVFIESDEVLAISDNVPTTYTVDSVTPFDTVDLGTTASDLGILGAFSDSTLLSTLNNGTGFTPGQFIISWGTEADIQYTVDNIKIPTAGNNETLTIYNENGSTSATVTLTVGDTLENLKTTIEAAIGSFSKMTVEIDSDDQFIQLVSTNEKITATNNDANNASITYNTKISGEGDLHATKSKSATIDLEFASTLGDVKRAVEKATNNEILVSYGHGNRLEFTLASNDVNETITIAETSDSSATAQSLGLIGISEIAGRTLRDGNADPLTQSTLLSDLGLTFNSAPATGSTENHLVLTSGADTISLDLVNAKTLGDVITAINSVSTSDQGNAIDFNAEIIGGRFLNIKNSQGTASNVLASDYSTAAEKLGLVPDPEKSSNIFFSGNELGVQNRADNFFAAISDIIEEMSGGNPDIDRVSNAMVALERMEDKYLAARAGVGARINRFDALKTRFEDEEIFLTGALGKRVEIDIIAVTQQFLQQQQVYQAGLSSVSRVLGLSLFDFI